MKRHLSFPAGLLAVSLFASAAMAGQCPADMAKIDAALAANPQLSAAQMEEVKKLRAQGEEQHNTGKHAASVETLAKAKEILGIK